MAKPVGLPSSIPMKKIQKPLCWWAISTTERLKPAP